MINNDTKKMISLDMYGIKNAKIKYNLSSDELHAIILQKGQ